MIFLVFFATSLRRSVAEQALNRILNPDDLEDVCWNGRPELQDHCCSQDHPECFDELFTREQCCPKSCLPLGMQEVGNILELASRFDAPRLSVSALPGTCTRMGLKPVYAVVRASKLVSVHPAFLSDESLAVMPQEVGLPRKLQIPVRSLMLCVPLRCRANQDLETLAVFVTERTLPASLHVSRLSKAEVILVSPLQDVGKHKGTPPDKDDVQGTGRHLGQADVLLQTAKLALSNVTSTSLVVLDVGTSDRSEFMEWLEADREERHLVIGFEPDPNSVSVHPTHPRLTLLQAAVARIPEGSVGHTALLHRSQNGVCSSLFALPSDPGLSGRLNWDAGCFKASEEGPVEVPILPLFDIIALLPAGQEVSLLKIDAQGGDLEVLISAGMQLQRVRYLQVEVTDLPRRHPDLVYGASQPTKEDLIQELGKRGFLLEACNPSVQQLHEENCLFVRADLLEERPSAEMSIIAAGDFRWDRPGIHFRYAGEYSL